MDFSLDFSGLADIARDLETLSRAENNKVLRDAMNRPGNPGD